MHLRLNIVGTAVRIVLVSSAILACRLCDRFTSVVLISDGFLSQQVGGIAGCRDIRCRIHWTRQ